MIIPDTNLLLYAYDLDCAQHRKAKGWWEDCLSGSESLGIPPVVIFGFARVATHGRVLRNPMTVSEASVHIRSWLEQPCVSVLNTSPGHMHAVLTLLETVGTGGNLLTDAQIAAMALDHGATVHTNDGDFMRFPGLRWFNPLSGDRSAR